MRNVTHYLRDSLRLTVNAQKSAVDRPRNRKFLGFTVSRDGARIKVADSAIDKLKAKIRELTRRTRGHRLKRHRARVEDCPDRVESLLRNCRSVESSARNRQMGATAAAMLCMETMGQRGLPRYFRKRGVTRALGLEHKQECAWPMAAESNASAESGTTCQIVSSNGATRTGTGQGSMRSRKFQGTAGYVTRMSGGVGGRGREASSYPD